MAFLDEDDFDSDDEIKFNNQDYDYRNIVDVVNEGASMSAGAGERGRSRDRVRQGYGQQFRDRDRDRTPPRARGDHFEPRTVPPTPKERAEKVIREAEAAKARMIEVTGRKNFYNPNHGVSAKVNLENEFVHSAMVDENFLLVAAHVDETLRKKIEDDEYVDFAKLLPRDQVKEHNDNRFEWVIEEGHTYLAPAQDRNRVNGV